jgi:putative transposase
MGRPHRAAEGGYVYHVLNRANARMTIFADAGDYETGEYEAGDYEAFEKVLAEAVEQDTARLGRWRSAGGQENSRSRASDFSF